MGRRLLLIFGMMLLALATAAVARGQSGEVTGKPSDSAPALSPSAGDLPKREESTKADPDLKRAEAPVPAQTEAPAGTAAAGNPSVAGDGSPDASPSGAAATELESEKTALDRLPPGKQSVAVTVDVVAPASMNRNKEATLKLIVRNTGTSDAFNVVVHDELPEGLEHVSSQPKANEVAKSLLTWQLHMIPAGTESLITLKVKPTKPGSFDHAATVTFMTGCKSRTSVVEPKLKVDVVVNPTKGNVLKGQPVEFKVSVTNTGDGPARNVSIKAKLSGGLKHESEEREYELMLPDLAQNQTEKLDPLVTTALVKGEQSCTVTATSPDVVFNKEEAENTKTIMVVAPELKLALSAPESRYTDTVADYEINLTNTGSAPAHKVRVLTTLPVDGKLKIPKDADYDRATRRLQWKVDQVDPGATLKFPFQVRMMGSGLYECIVEATADGTAKVVDRRNTEVMGMPLIELDVSEPKHVLDVDGLTTFLIRISNSGTKDATNLVVTAKLSENLTAEAAGNQPKKVKGHVSTDGYVVQFDDSGKAEPPGGFKIAKLPRDKEILLGVKVRVKKAEPKLATCRVTVKHDDLSDEIDDMAGVKVIPPGRTANSAKGKTTN